MQESQDDDGSKHIPACQRCRLRKIKCDRQPPKCSSCTKAKAACIVVDPVTSEKYSREYIHQLEAREQELQATIAATPTSSSVDHERGASTEPGQTIAVGQTPGNLASESAATPRGFVGDGSGLGFLRFIFSDARWQVYKPQILEHLTERPQIPELALSPNAQPLLEEASELLDNYFARFHIHHTFLLRQDVLSIFNRIYHGSHPQPPTAQDYFRLFMVFSISAVTRYRKGASSEHPYGYYLAAQAYLGSIALMGSVDAIQNLLLVSRFGMYHHIGTSLWEISQFCMRQCIEQRLHARPSRTLELLKEQHQRRIFWECYILDRYSSGVLGRPFAIAEADIGVDLPIDAADETIAEASLTLPSLSDVPLSPDCRPTELSVFIFCIRLRRITSRIHTAFYSGRGLSSSNGDAIPVSHVSSGHVYVLLYRFLGELESWRQGAPAFAKPRSLYERTEWYDFLLEKDKLLLVRGAVHMAPRRNGQPPEDLLVMCFDCATQVIELYNSMLENKYITWTRSYFQVIFAAGLSIIYCVSLGLHGDIAKSDRTLNLCGDILLAFKKEMPDAGRFAIVFGILKDHFLRDSYSSLAVAHGQGLSNSSLSHVLAPGPGTRPPLQGSPSVSVHAMARPESGGAYMLPTDPHSFNSAHGNGLGYGMPVFGTDQEALPAWPTLTAEMMEHLEAGLGEFAWGTTGTDIYSWDHLC